MKLMRFKKVEGWSNPRYVNKLGEKHIEASPMEKNLEVLVDEKLVMS